MGDPTGEAASETLRLDFDRRLMLQFRGSAITSDWAPALRDHALAEIRKSSTQFKRSNDVRKHAKIA